MQSLGWHPYGDRLLLVADGEVIDVEFGGSRLGVGPGNIARWAPDGLRLAVGDNQTLLLKDVGTGASRVLIDGLGQIGDFTWLEDSRSVVFVASEIDPGTLLPIGAMYMLDADSSDLEVLATGLIRDPAVAA